MMKFVWAVLVVACVYVSAPAQDRGVGLGIILGEPTGISFKGWLSSRNAVDAGMAWSFRGDGYLHLHADYLWHFTGVFPGENRIVLYAGPGARLGAAKGGSVFGIRIAGGAAYWIKGVPIEVFLEIAPVMDLAPATEAALNGGIGARFYFQ